MGKLRGILRVSADLGIVLIVVLIAALAISKIVSGEGSSASPDAQALAPRTLPTMTNSIGMRLVRIPAGEFSMGSSSYSKETAVHTVRFAKDYWMGQHEVTQAEHRQIAGRDPSARQGGTLPVEQVSWEEAAEFCRRLSAREGRRYRLPTEAEWEHACRAGSRSTFSFGDDDTRLGEFAWYDASAGHKTHPVGSRKPNAWGLHDMHGNVWEWCSDWHQEDYYAASPAQDPQGPASGELRVLRGGAFYNRPVFCRSARRDFNRPDYRDEGIGFRVVMEADAETPKN